MKQPDYLEIYPSEVAARKIGNHLDKMMELKPRVYRKTILRYTKLAYLLLECVKKIVELLQSNEMKSAMLLSSENSEFQELMSDFDTEQIDELRNSVDDLGNLINKTPSKEVKSLARDTMKQYRTVFGQAANVDYGYVEVNECGDLLNYWITRRFSDFNPNFKYSINQLPVWATYIVIAYGKYHSVGQSNVFVQEFREWCDSLDTDLSNCWALPYNVFNMTRVIDPKNFTLDAMVIYDILVNGCLYQLIDGKNKIPMDSSYIAKLVKEYHPEYAHEVRTRFTKQNELIEIVHLRSTTALVEESL